MSTGRAGRGPRLHRPLRPVVAAAELIVEYPIDGTPHWLTLVDGRWLATAVGAATLGALLLLDAGRQLALAVHTRRRSPSEPDGPGRAGTAAWDTGRCERPHPPGSEVIGGPSQH